MVNKFVKIQIVFYLIFFVQAQEILRSQDATGQNFLFSYGSCFSQKRILQQNKTSIFEKISENKPDVFAWLGDFGYSREFENIKQNFEFTKNERGYKMLQDNNVTQIVGVWDDHDYGKNDGIFKIKKLTNIKIFPYEKYEGDKNYKFKHLTRQMYLDYMDEPKDSIRRTQPGGIYTSYYLGETKKVKLVLLDVRFSRDSFWFEHSDILGPDQWKWLEGEFNDPHSHTIILASGCQILPDDRIIPEKWYPDSRNRLFDLIQQHKDHQRVVLISGDIHLAEILAEPNSVQRYGYNLFEITSSGLTHHVLDYKFPKFLVDGFLPNTFNDRQHRLMDFNFALVDIKLDSNKKENTKLTFSIKDQYNTTKLQVIFEPWKEEQEQVNLTSSKYTRKDHRYKRWFIWMLKNYFVEYRKQGIIILVIGLALVTLAFIVCKKVYTWIKNRKEGQQKQKTN